MTLEIQSPDDLDTLLSALGSYIHDLETKWGGPENSHHEPALRLFNQVQSPYYHDEAEKRAFYVDP